MTVDDLEELDRILEGILYGDNRTGEPGLYRTLKGSQTWEAFQRSVGMIEGLELARNEVAKYRKRLHDQR